jgi:hypothetical protein
VSEGVPELGKTAEGARRPHALPGGVELDAQAPGQSMSA